MAAGGRRGAVRVREEGRVGAARAAAVLAEAEAAAVHEAAVREDLALARLARRRARDLVGAAAGAETQAPRRAQLGRRLEAPDERAALADAQRRRVAHARLVLGRQWRAVVVDRAPRAAAPPVRRHWRGAGAATCVARAGGGGSLRSPGPAAAESSRRRGSSEHAPLPRIYSRGAPCGRFASGSRR